MEYPRLVIRMMFVVVIMALAAQAQADTQPDTLHKIRLKAAPPPWLMQGMSWDAELQIGYSVVGKMGPSGPFLMRLRLGILRVRLPWILSFDATGELGGLVPGGGLQIGLTHIKTGLWTHVGGSIGKEARPSLSFAVGWSIFGLEWQKEFRSYAEGPQTMAVIIRIPMGIIEFMRHH